MGRTANDLSKHRILVERTLGDSQPGSARLDRFVREAAAAINWYGGKVARYFATDMCEGINYSLPHQKALDNLFEACPAPAFTMAA